MLAQKVKKSHYPEDAHCDDRRADDRAFSAIAPYTLFSKQFSLFFSGGTLETMNMNAL
jgi:hypothetical protein